MNEIERHFRAASRAASKEVERRARRILADNPDLREFVMGMGCYSFWDLQGNALDGDDPRTEAVDDLIMEWDCCLRITGETMRFTATGPKITSW